jgi:undecaprenyl diphosphate synthase
MTTNSRSKPDEAEIHPVLGIPLNRMPRHIAIIMDGNGRWAEQRGLPRLEGHRNGSKGVRNVITETARLGVECLTLYSFSTENWKRPPKEVKGLMALYEEYLIQERPTIMHNNIKVRHLGNEKELPENVLRELHETMRLSRDNTGMTLSLALNYSGRQELIGAISRMVSDARDDRLKAGDVDDATVSSYLDTAGLPDPDLLVRTAGEMRISNFLLWQISYAELYVTDVLWPDFSKETLYGAIRDFASRNRRFGGLVDTK